MVWDLAKVLLVVIYVRLGVSFRGRRLFLVESLDRKERDRVDR